ncbi:unnamed protein product [Boreogadus saida]
MPGNRRGAWVATDEVSVPRRGPFSHCELLEVEAICPVSDRLSPLCTPRPDEGNCATPDVAEQHCMTPDVQQQHCTTPDVPQQHCMTADVCQQHITPPAGLTVNRGS